MKDKKNIIIGIIAIVIVALITIIILMFTGVIKLKEKEVVICKKDEEKELVEENVLAILDEAKLYYSKNENDNIIDLTKNLIDLKDNTLTKGYVKFSSEDNFESKMYINGYCITFNSVEGIKETLKIEEEKCNIEKLYKTYKNGTPLYFNPTTGLMCNKSESKDYVTSNYKTTVTSSGCMEWYAFLDDEKSENVKLQLNHGIAYTDDDFSNKTKNWKQTVDGNSTSIKPRIISMEEITKIAPTKSGKFDINDENSSYYFLTGTKIGYYCYSYETTEQIFNQRSIIGGKYAWLVNNLYMCGFGGCEKSMPIDVSGYVTSTVVKVKCGNDCYEEERDKLVDKVWVVTENGSVNLGIKEGTERWKSIRPVIEISKKVFETK